MPRQLPPGSARASAPRTPPGLAAPAGAGRTPAAPPTTGRTTPSRGASSACGAGGGFAELGVGEADLPAHLVHGGHDRPALVQRHARALGQPGPHTARNLGGLVVHPATDPRLGVPLDD